MSAAAAGVPARDPFDVRRAVVASGLLRTFNDAGVLAAADVHVARRLARIGAEEDEWLALAAALAVRGPRLGHVCVDLETISRTATVDAEDPVDVASLPWPPAAEWLERVAGSDLVAVGEDEPDGARPLRLVSTTLYLDRYWREENEVAADLASVGAEPTGDVNDDRLAAGLARLFGEQASGRQALAAASAVLSRFAVVAGGPGTGKTTTVARIVALLLEQAEGAERPPLVALAAPTAKAANRLRDAVRSEAATLDVDEAVRERLLALDASTLHRLLGKRPDSHSRFRHDRDNRLPHDVVIVDETSMVSLSLMARLVEAVRPGARLILVGDPAQLASVEAGAVLGDVVGPAPDGLRIAEPARERLARVLGRPVEASDAPPGAAIREGIVVLDEVHRYGAEIAQVAETIRRGDAAGVVAALRDAPDRVTWLEADVADPSAADALGPVRDAVAATARAVTEAARAGDASAALAAMRRIGVLCAHRRGPYGVAAWTARIEEWLAGALDDFAGGRTWYAGRPLLVTRNDYGLRLFNGDTGVVVRAGDGRLTAAFDRGGELAEVRPSRLGAVETVYAMTVHKAQGSQFETAAVLLPDPASPILTRELLYTAVTRTRNHLIIAGTEDAIRAAVERPVARASGLRERLWGDVR